MECMGLLRVTWGGSNLEIIIGSSTPLHMLIINESHIGKAMPKVLSPDQGTYLKDKA